MVLGRCRKMGEKVEIRNIAVIFCRVCKNELGPRDVTTICDGCLFSLGDIEDGRR